VKRLASPTSRQVPLASLVATAIAYSEPVVEAAMEAVEVVVVLMEPDAPAAQGK
jgi:hypothetical protein